MKTTNIILILDSSGSMHSIREQAVENYNEQIRAFKQAAAEGNVKVSLITFNNEVYEHLWSVPANDCTECTQGDYKADGWTSMLDAMGHGIEKMRETTNVEDPENVYLMVVISDGQENASKHYTRPKLFEMIDSLQRTNRWTFTFMGCNESYIRQEAQSLGIPAANCAMWDNTSAVKARASYRTSSVRMASAVRGLASGAMNFCSNTYSDEPEMMADFTNAPDPVGMAVDPVAAPPIAEGATNVFSNRTQVTSWNA